MFHYVTGDLLKNKAEALVNTVNCEGYMGKGIAYQFKLQFPDNNKDYIKACKNGELQPGKLHFYKEHEKIIINFPTKNKWREKSKIEYIEKGLDELVKLIVNLNIKSIAIPPLGSGNGGLNWSDVKSVIEKKLYDISNVIDIYIFEPSRNYISTPVYEPKLSVSALILMIIKCKLSVFNFNKVRLQKTAYFVDLFSKKKYFKFVAYKYGPYDHSIDILSQRIREFQLYYKTKSTEEAKDILYNKIISENVNNLLKSLEPSIEKACNFVNTIETNHELEGLATICFLIEQSNGLTEKEILNGFKNWSDEKAVKFKEPEIIEGIQKLYNAGIIEKNLIEFTIAA